MDSFYMQYEQNANLRGLMSINGIKDNTDVYLRMGIHPSPPQISMI